MCDSGETDMIKQGTLSVKAVLRMLVVGMVFLPGFAVAGSSAESSADEQAGVFSLGEVVVEGRGETITQVTTVDIVDEERIELTTSQNVADAIRTVPGVTLYSTASPKNESNFMIRGLEQRYVPVFFDGIPISVPYDGYVDTGKLTSSNIAKISVSKGISSVLYGFNTMGGVVNIVTKKPHRLVEGDFDVTWSERNTWDANVDLGARVGKFYLTLNGGYFDSDGFMLAHRYRYEKLQKGRRRINSDVKDRWSGSCKLGFLPFEGHEYALGVMSSDGEWGLPPASDGIMPRFFRFSEWEKTTGYFIGETRITDKLHLKTRVYYDKYDNLLDGYDNVLYDRQTAAYAFHSTYDDYSAGGSAVVRMNYIPRTTTSFSFHYRDDVHKSQADRFESWLRFEAEMFSYGCENDIKITDDIFLVFGFSYDRQEPQESTGYRLRDDEDAWNPQVGLTWQVVDDTRFHLSYGKKSRFPTMHELYSERLGMNVPNPGLKVERAENWEVGIEQQLPGDTTARVNLFYYRIKDMIIKKEIATKLYQYTNLGKVRLQGVEVSFKTGFIKNNDFEMHYTLLDAEDLSSESTSSHLWGRSKHNLYISDHFRINSRLSLFGKVTWQSKTYFEDTNDYNKWKKHEAYMLVDLKAILQVTDYLSFEAGAKNLFDENYKWADGYPRPGRTFFTTLRGKF